MKIVYETFEKLHNDGLLYRGKRIGNFVRNEVKHLIRQ